MDSFKIAEFNIDNLFEEIEKDLFSEEFTLKNLGNNNVTARHLQYWSDNDLLPESKRKQDENHKFNFVELIWIKIIYELRVLGFNINKIKIVKDTLLKKKSLPEHLGLTDASSMAECFYKIFKDKLKITDKEKFIKSFQPHDTSNTKHLKKISVLHFLILFFIDQRENSKLIILNEGETFPLVSDSVHTNPALMELLEKETYISVPLFKLISDFIEDEKNYSFISKAQILNNNELKILFLLRNGKFDSMTIHFKKGDPFLIEPKKKMQLSKDIKLSEILLKRGYEKIEIVTQDGNITYSPKTTKIFL